MNLNKRQQLLGILAIGAVALLAGDRLVFTPLTRLWKDRSEQLAQTKKSFEHGTQVLAREKVIRERWDRMRTNTLSSEISVAESEVWRAFDRWSQGNGITINGLKPQWKHNADDYATLECRVDATGTLPQITRFLYEIEKDPLGIKVDILEMTARDDRGQQLTLNLQVSGLQLNPPATP
jgi:hypothetical protein